MGAIIPFLVAGATWLSRIGIAVFAYNEIKKAFSDNKPTLEASSAQAAQAGLSEEEQRKMVAAVTYDQIEQQGKSPDEWWGKLTPEEQQALKFSPETLREDMQRTKFLGIAQTLLWIGAGVATGVAGFKGLPVSLRGLAEINALKQKGVAASVIANELSILRTAILNKTWIPGSVAGILGAGGWLAGGLMNSLNDATLWGRIFLNQAHDDVAKAAKNTQSGSGTSGGSSGTINEPRTIIRMVTEEKPKQFIGTLFSAKLGSAEQFERVLDDKITDMQDLEADVKLNLNKWLSSLPNRMGYSIVIRKDPVDEFGAQQSGIWATLTLFITHISGKVTPIDTILLGPVEPQVRLELQKRTTTVENQISGFIEATQVKEIQIPAGSVDIFSPSGERMTLSGTISGSNEAVVQSTTKQENTTENNQTQTTQKKAFIKSNYGQIWNTKYASEDVIKAADQGIYQYIDAPTEAQVVYRKDIPAYEALDVNGKRIDLYPTEAEAYRAIGKSAPIQTAAPAPPQPPSAPTQTQTPPTGGNAPSGNAGAGAAVVYYVVKSGDTLGAIANRYGVSVSAISGFRSGNPNLIYPGETLTIRKASGSIPLP